MLADYPQARLLLVGEGPDRTHFESLAKGDKRIVFAGFQREVGSWIAAMDVFCFPSREEGLGSSVLDAMALGIPVVASAVGGLPELIGHDERGFLVGDHVPGNWSRSIMRILNDVAARKLRIGAARQFAGANGVAAMTKKYFGLYGDIINGVQYTSNCAERVGLVRH
jgi:glycosyltransferase involved in cell wall biosynthesis